MIGNLAEFTATEKRKIARHNDSLRVHGVGGIIFLEDHILQQSLPFQKRLMAAIRDYKDFTDPYHQHGEVKIGKQDAYWNISAVNREDLSLSGVDPTDPINSFRKMVVGLSNSGIASAHFPEKYHRLIEQERSTTNQLKVHIPVPLTLLKERLGPEDYERIRRSISDILESN